MVVDVPGDLGRGRLVRHTQRTGYSIGQYLRDRLGMSIVPVNLRGEGALGERGYRRLADVSRLGPGPGPSFVNSQRVGAVVDQAIARRIGWASRPCGFSCPGSAFGAGGHGGSGAFTIAFTSSQMPHLGNPRIVGMDRNDHRHHPSNGTVPFSRKWDSR
jgi:hypothetical protein